MMTSIKRQILGWTSLFVLLIAMLSLAIGFPPAIQANDDLPDRSTPTPTATIQKKDRKKADVPIGAYIYLQPTESVTGGWAVVQWQDFDGNWHDVEGWQGLTNGGGQRWWVAQKDFNTGPFRWIVRTGPDGDIIALSALFMLPGEANTTLPVEISAIQ